MLVAGIASGNPGLIIAGSLLTAAGVGAVTYVVVEHRNGRNAVGPVAAAQRQNAAAHAIEEVQAPQPAALERVVTPDEIVIATNPLAAEGGMSNDGNDQRASRSPNPAKSDRLSGGRSRETNVQNAN